MWFYMLVVWSDHPLSQRNKVTKRAFKVDIRMGVGQNLKKAGVR